jgi:hypothetical protein
MESTIETTIETTIEKLQNINTFLSILEDKDRINIETGILQHLLKIGVLINDMYSEITTLELSQDKFDQVESQNQKEKIIVEFLFPYYWMINEYVSTKDNNETRNILDNLGSLHKH